MGMKKIYLFIIGLLVVNSVFGQNYTNEEFKEIYNKCDGYSLGVIYGEKQLLDGAILSFTLKMGDYYKKEIETKGWSRELSFLFISASSMDTLLLNNEYSEEAYNNFLKNYNEKIASAYTEYYNRKTNFLNAYTKYQNEVKHFEENKEEYFKKCSEPAKSYVMKLYKHYRTKEKYLDASLRDSLNTNPILDDNAVGVVSTIFSSVLKEYDKIKPYVRYCLMEKYWEEIKKFEELILK